MNSKTIFISIFIALFLINLSFSYCQRNEYLAILPANTSHPTLEREIEEAYKSDIEFINKNKKTIRKDIKEYLLYRKLYIQDLIKNGLIINDSAFTSYYQNILNELIKANPMIDSKIRVYITRLIEPNAFNTGDGNIYFNLGLLRHLETDDQIAFVIAHEVAHQHFKHNLNKIILSVNTINTDEVQKKIKQASNQRYGSKEALKEIQNSLVFDVKKHGRNKESEADSFAVELLKKSRYNIYGAISTLKILEDIDEKELKLSHITYTDYFKEIPIVTRKEWNMYNVDSSYIAIREKKTVIADSLRTHPDCKVRVAALKSRFESEFKTNNKIQTIYTNKNNALIEYLQSCILLNNIGFGIHENIRLLENHNDNIDLNLMLSKNFGILNYNQRNRTLGYVLDVPSDIYPVEYNYTLSFLNSLKLIESGAISYYALLKLPVNTENEEYLYSTILSLFAYRKFEEMEKNIYLYKLKFNSGKYLQAIKLLQEKSKQ